MKNDLVSTTIEGAAEFERYHNRHEYDDDIMFAAGDDEDDDCDIDDCYDCDRDNCPYGFSINP
jgi:trehalose-6-phosphatase